MKHFFRYVDGEQVEVPEGGLKAMLELNQQYLQNYEELFDDLDDPSFVARGNGFCDAKFSEDFVDGQIRKYRARVEQLLKSIQ